MKKNRLSKKADMAAFRKAMFSADGMAESAGRRAILKRRKKK